jgi:hypothetical protein
MASPHSPLGFLIGRGFSPSKTNPHFPLSERLGSVKQLGLLSIGPTGLAISVVSRGKKDWEFSKVEEVQQSSDFPSIPEKALAQLKKVSGRGDVCISIGFSLAPHLFAASGRADEREEMRDLVHNPSKLIPEYKLGDNFATTLVRNSRTASTLMVSIDRTNIRMIMEALTQAGLTPLRVQSTCAGLLDLAGGDADVMAGKSHFAVLDHSAVTFIETSETGDWINVHYDAEAGRNQGQGLAAFFSKVAATVKRKPLLFLPSTRAQAEKHDLSDASFPSANTEEMFSATQDHLAAKAILSK